MQSRRRAAAIAVSACAAMLASACSIPSRPEWWPKSPDAGSSPQAAAVNRARAAVPVVAHVWHHGAPQLGIDVYWTANTTDTDADIRAKARRMINYAISLHANSIGLSFPFYTYGISSDTVYTSKPTTPSPARIAIFLSEAAKSHIRVTLRPLLSEDSLVAQNPLAWRGSIEPVHRSAWFRSYKRLLRPYAAVAASGHAATFVIGTELASLEGDPHWPSLIRAIRSAYHGQLRYDENYVQFAAHATNLPLSAFGVDAYPRFQLSDSATVGQLTRAWKGWLGAHTMAVRRRAVLSEVGIDAVAGSYPDPGAWLETTQSPIDTRVQKNWYKAVCRAFAAERVGGLYWWEVSFDADPADPGPFQSDRITFLGRSAQREVKTCFASLTARERKRRLTRLPS
jgi:hypothetical protein